MLTGDQKKNLDDIYEEIDGSLNLPGAKMSKSLLCNNDTPMRESTSDIRKENRAYLTWSNVTYYVRHKVPKTA